MCKHNENKYYHTKKKSYPIDPEKIEIDEVRKKRKQLKKERRRQKKERKKQALKVKREQELYDCYKGFKYCKKFDESKWIYPPNQKYKKIVIKLGDPTISEYQGSDIYRLKDKKNKLKEDGIFKNTKNFKKDMIHLFYNVLYLGSIKKC